MNSFVGVLKREWLEHRAGFIWGPASVLVLILLIGLMATLVEPHVEGDIGLHDPIELREKLNGEARQLSFLETVATMALDVAGSTDAELKGKMAKLLGGLAQPFHLVFIIMAFFALIACLYDERKDQSVLFWKSMPVSDLQTVAGKLVFVIWLAPLLTVLAIAVAQLFAVTMTSVFVEEGMGGRIWSASQIWVRPFELLVRYLLLGVWALPLAAWVMLVSAAANRLPILWALGLPWLVFLLERIFLGSNVLGELVGGHFSLLTASPRDVDVEVFGQLAMLGTLRLWVGLVIGLVFVAGAVFFRRRNNEI